MSVIGFSILIASLSFFCYKNPPSSWLITHWLRRPSLTHSSKPPLNEAPSIQFSEPSVPDEDIPEKTERKAPAKVPLESISSPPPPATQLALDRAAMPPPPPPFLRKAAPPPSQSPPSSPPTPRASKSTPSFSLPTSEDEEPTIPSFPALNSAQRASGGIRGPPRLTPQSQASFIPSSGGGLGGLMPPPRGPLPNRAPQSSGMGLAPPPTHTAIPTKPRRKVLLTPGHSPLDWARLTSSPTANLTGLPPGTPYLRVPPSLLKQMTGRKGKDAWTVLGGKVYNISPYAAYHPGGEPELMKAAGRDGTRLFGEVHPWVNWEGMLEGCLVGVAVDEGDVKAEGKWEEMD